MPIGIIGAISPFNFPLNLVAHKLAPAIAAGCAVILKPASSTPVTALRLAAILEEAGLPAGWLSVLPGNGSEIGGVLTEDERVRMITFTGSSEVGWGIRQRAFRKKVALELGNASPVLVEADADLELASSKVATHAFSFAGQTCVSVQRVYVRREVFDDFVAKLLPKVDALKAGDPSEDEIDVGPVIDRSNHDRVLEWIDEAKAGGATVLSGGVEENGVIRPTVLTDVTPEMNVCRREVFGPVCSADSVRLARRGLRARELHRVRASVRDLHAVDRAGDQGDRRARVRQCDDQRGAGMARRPDAVRRHQGVGEHEGGPRLHDSRDDRGASRRPRRRLSSSEVVDAPPRA